MSGIGTAASILQLASAATKISFQAYEFITTIKNAPREIENLGSDMMNFYLLVNNLTDALESRDIRGFVDQDAQLNKAMKSLFIPMAKCQLSCDQVNEKLKLLDFQTDPESEGLLSEKNASGDEPKKSRTWVRDWMWPFRRREIFAMMTEFDRSRSIFSDSMSSLTLILTLKQPVMAMDQTSKATQRHSFNDDAGSAIAEFASTHATLIPTSTTEEGDGFSDPKYVEELMGAVRRGSVSLVEIMLNSVNVNARDLRDGRTALSYAAQRGDMEMVKLLLKRGADTNTRQYSLSKPYRNGGNSQPMRVSGRLPIHWAVANNHSEVTEILLQYGANPNARNTSGRSVLQDACMNNDTKSVRLLLRYGADVNARSYNGGWSGLHEAATWNLVEVLEILLEYNPLLDVPAIHDPEGCAPIHIATRWGHIEIMKLLLSKRADPDIPMLEDITALHLAAAGGLVNELNLLLNWGASPNPQDARLRETPLHKAARNLELEAIENLLLRGAETDVPNIDGRNYEFVLDCAQRYPDDWYISTRLGSFCSWG